MSWSAVMPIVAALDRGLPLSYRGALAAASDPGTPSTHASLVLPSGQDLPGLLNRRWNPIFCQSGSGARDSPSPGDDAPRDGVAEKIRHSTDATLLTHAPSLAM